MNMTLVDYTDWRLYTDCREWDFSNPPVETELFARELAKTMNEKRGIGLAAPQVGFPYRVFAMAGGSEGDYVCFNPTIVEESEEVITLEEGCLSYPGLSMKVARPRHVRVRFQGPDAQVYTKTFANMSARIFQHEMDHLAGFTLLHGPSRLKRDMAIKKAAKRGFRYDPIAINVGGPSS